MKIHQIVTILDENGIDHVGEFLSQLEMETFTNAKMKVHLAFLASLFDRLEFSDLKSLCKSPQELDVVVDGQQWTKRYTIVKPLRVIPIFELRYAMNGNEHVRFLFFPLVHKGMSYLIFTKAFIKSLNPRRDDTNKLRDLTYKLFLKVSEEPRKYLEGDE